MNNLWPGGILLQVASSPFFLHFHTYIFSLFLCVKVISAWAFHRGCLRWIIHREWRVFLHFYGTLLKVPTQTLVLGGRQQEWTTMVRQGVMVLSARPHLISKDTSFISLNPFQLYPALQVFLIFFIFNFILILFPVSI